jgi:hypothetical protein
MKMALLRSGNRSKLIEIIANNYSLVITGDVERNKSKITRFNVNIPAAIIVYSYNNENVTLKTITDFGELVENSGNTMMPCFFENGRYQLILEVKEKKEYEIFLGGIRITDDFQGVGNCYIGIVDFSSDIGYTNIDIYEETKKILTVTIEIFPSKLDYFKDYKEIINEINEEVCSLAFKFIDKTYVSSKLKDVEHQTNAEFISILDVVFEDLRKSLKRIVNNFKHNVITEDRIADIHKAKKISKKSISYICKHPEILIKSNKGFILVNGEQYYSTTVIEEIKNTTIDIFENRFVKYMIQRIINRLFSIEKLLREDNPHEKHTLESIRRKIKILESYYKRYFQNIRNLTGNKSMSLVFQMAPGYKEMYKKYSILNKGLDLGEDIYKITPKKLYDLYEIWCYIKIHKTLIDLGYQVEEYGILKYKDNGMHLSLLQDSEAKMIYKNNRNKLELWYNKSYNLPTTNQRPDTVLCITSSNVNDNRMYIFDAKYRIAIDEKGTVGPMEDDINIMHRYRDAIVSKMNDDFKYKYETFGAYVMFPYGNEEKYINHKFYNSIEEVNVGAFPMLPGSTKLITEHLDKIINQSNIEAKSKRIALDEYDDYAKFKLENVMVVNVKDKNHLDSYLKNKFYHIPIKRLSNVRLGVEYLAFYQSKKSFGDDSGIKYYAKINNVYKYSREECVEIPTRRDNKKEIYLRFELDDIKEISPIKPIQSGTQLVSYTTLYLLLNAENMHELKLNSNLEIEVYKILKNLAEENNWSIRKEYNKYLMNNNTVDIIENKRIRVNGKIINLKGLKKELLG